MNLDNSDNRRRALTLGLLGVPFIILALFVDGLVVAHAQHHTRVVQLLQERENAKDLMRNAPRWHDQITKLNALSQSAPLFFGSAELNSAAARMQNEVSSAIAVDHVSVLRNEIELKADNDSKRTELHLLLTFDGDIATVTHVLFHLRQARPFLFVRKLELRASPQTAAALLSGPNLLQAELAIVGFVQTP
jgi:type II secretion system (T2SS) protein M